MLKSKVIQALGKNVKVILYDGSEYIGKLTSTTEFPYEKDDYYFTQGSLHTYRSSHIKKIILLESEEKQ